MCTIELVGALVDLLTTCTWLLPMFIDAQCFTLTHTNYHLPTHASAFMCMRKLPMALVVLLRRLCVT